MCFQCTDDIPIAPTDHLFHLHMEGLRHIEFERGYHVLISIELRKRLEKLHIDEFRWVKPKILKEADKFYYGSFDESSEE